MSKSKSFLIDCTFIHTYGFIETLIIMYLDNEIDKFIPCAYIYIIK